jgi:hypothetical protein
MLLRRRLLTVKSCLSNYVFFAFFAEKPSFLRKIVRMGAIEARGYGVDLSQKRLVEPQTPAP